MAPRAPNLGIDGGKTTGLGEVEPTPDACLPYKIDVVRKPYPLRVIEPTLYDIAMAGPIGPRERPHHGEPVSFAALADVSVQDSGTGSRQLTPQRDRKPRQERRDPLHSSEDGLG